MAFVRLQVNNRVYSGGMFGAGIQEVFAGIGTRVEKNKAAFLEYLAEYWVFVVRSTAFIKPPAKRNTIIARVVSNDRLSIGWQNYRGGDAFKRFGMRRSIFELQMGEVVETFPWNDDNGSKIAFMTTMLKMRPAIQAVARKGLK